MRPISRVGVPGGWLAGGVGTQRQNLVSHQQHPRCSRMDPRVIHRRFMRIVTLVYGKPFSALPQALPVFSSHPLHQAETERVGTPIPMESRDG